MNVPHRVQEQANSCLAACVRMALAYYGVDFAEADLRRLLRTRGMGTSPARVMIELPRLGFLAYVLDGNLRLLADYLADDVVCIVHLWTEHLTMWGGHDPVVHAVIVTAVADTAVVVNDPTRAEPGLAVPKAEFMAAWQGSDFLLIAIQPLDR